MMKANLWRTSLSSVEEWNLSIDYSLSRTSQFNMTILMFPATWYVYRPLHNQHWYSFHVFIQTVYGYKFMADILCSKTSHNHTTTIGVNCWTHYLRHVWVLGQLPINNSVVMYTITSNWNYKFSFTRFHLLFHKWMVIFSFKKIFLVISSSHQARYLILRTRIRPFHDPLEIAL